MIGTCSAATQTVCSNYSCVDLERLDLSERQRGDRIGKSALAPSMSASLAPVPDAEVRSDVRYHSFGATGVDEPQRDWKQRAVPLVAVSIALFGLFAMVHAGTSSPPPPAPMLTNKVARLEIINGCERDPLWIANFAFQTPYFPQDLHLRAGESHGFDIPDEGLAATRFWAKWGCDKTGSNCKIGQSGGPGEGCPADGCAPPIDSKFEASFGCLPSVKSERCAVNPSLPSEHLGSTDWWDVSQVDGWTLPYKVKVVGDCPAAPDTIDCSRLSLTSCPNKEDLGLKGGPSTLRLFDLNNHSEVTGCYSPCAKLTNSQWGQGHAFTPDAPEARDFCCPTPPIEPDKCSSGPVGKTSYVKAVHELCPSVYAYAYDDGIGLAQCPAGTRYEVTFYCPAIGK